MSTSNKNSKIYSQDDFHQAKRLDRIWMWLMQPDDFELSYDEEDHLDNLKKVWTILFKQGSNRMRVNQICEMLDTTERKVFKYIEEAKFLFGDMLKIDVQLEMGVLREKFMLLGQKAEKAGDLETAKKCYEQAVKFVLKAEQDQPKIAKSYPTIIFSDDPKLLQANAASEVDILELEAIEIPKQHPED